jgi:hypothetical protein
MIHGAFLGWVCTKLEEGWRIDSCYEAGASGYWLHRELVELGVRNLVVAPKAMGGAEAKRQKTDKRDSAQLCDALDRYLRGQDVPQCGSSAHFGAGTEPGPDPISSPDYGGSLSGRRPGQRVAVC